MILVRTCNCVELYRMASTHRRFAGLGVAARFLRAPKPRALALGHSDGPRFQLEALLARKLAFRLEEIASRASHSSVSHRQVGTVTFASCVHRITFIDMLEETLGDICGQLDNPSSLLE